eukprot:tig00020903_g15119.t1
MSGSGIFRAPRVHVAPAPGSGTLSSKDEDGTSEAAAPRVPSRIEVRSLTSRFSPPPPSRLPPHTSFEATQKAAEGTYGDGGARGHFGPAAGAPAPGPGPPRRARRAQRGPSSNSLGRKQALASWFSETFASWEKPSFVPRSFPDPAIEHEFQEEWIGGKLSGARFAVTFGITHFLITAALFVLGYYKGLVFGAVGGGSPSQHLAAIVGSIAVGPVGSVTLAWLDHRRILSRSRVQLGVSCVNVAMYASMYYAARTTDTTAFLFTRVCSMSFVSPLFLGLSYAQALLVNGCGAALAVAFLVDFSYHGGNAGWDAALSLPVCIASVLFGTSAALRNEHAARRAFLLKREDKLGSEILKAKSAHLVSELQAFRSLTSSLDLTSPSAFAVNILGDLFEKLVEEGTQASTRHAEVVSAAVRCILAGARNGTALVEAGPPAARSSDADEVEALQEFKAWTSAFTGQGQDASTSSGNKFATGSPVPAPAAAPVAGNAFLRPSPTPPRASPASPFPRPGSFGDVVFSADLSSVAEAAVSDAWDDFDAFTLERHAGGRPLEFLATEVGRRTSILQANAVDVKKFRAFVASVEGGYKNVPYHSSTHAADVVQAMSWLLHAGGLRAHLRPLDALAALTAAVIHDVNHEGRNNGFEIATQSELAMLYNDQSMLENHSLALSFAALRSPATDFVSHLPKDQRAEFRRIIVGAVLATDMARHFEKVAEFKARVVASTLQTPPDSPGGQSSTGSAGDGETSRRGSGAAQFAPLTAADRGLFIALCLKVADISNAGRPKYQHVEWTSRVSEEFFLQGDEERRLGLPISPYCDRATTLPSAATAGFLSFLALPLLEAWASRFAAARPLIAHARANLAHWKLRDGRKNSLTSVPTSKAAGEGTNAAPQGATATPATAPPPPPPAPPALSPPELGLPPPAKPPTPAGAPPPARRLSDEPTVKSPASRASSLVAASLSPSPTPR